MLFFSVILLSLKCVVEPPVAKDIPATQVTSVVGRISSSDRELAGKPCLGIATMLADKTLVLHYTDMFVGHKHSELKLEYREGSAGYKAAVEAVGGIKPGETKVIPPGPPSIGVASMAADGTLLLQLRINSPDGAVGEGVVKIKPGDPRYDKVVRHIGIKPGQVKPMPPWGIDLKP